MAEVSAAKELRATIKLNARPWGHTTSHRDVGGVQRFTHELFHCAETSLYIRCHPTICWRGGLNALFHSLL